MTQAVDLMLFLFTVLLTKELIDLATEVVAGSRRSKWKCVQCGMCCSRYRVSVKKDDIARIERAGFSRNEFLSRGALKKVDGSCFFLRRRGGKAFCSIHEIKPDVCRRFPFRHVAGGVYVATSRNCPGVKKLF